MPWRLSYNIYKLYAVYVLCCAAFYVITVCSKLFKTWISFVSYLVCAAFYLSAAVRVSWFRSLFYRSFRTAVGDLNCRGVLGIDFLDDLTSSVLLTCCVAGALCRRQFVYAHLCSFSPFFCVTLFPFLLLRPVLLRGCNTRESYYHYQYLDITYKFHDFKR